MLFTTVAVFLLPAAIMAAPPAQKPVDGDDLCVPTSYIMSEYTLTRSPSYTFLSFNIESTYTVDSRQDDPVDAGANCEADGAEIDNQNECNIAGRKIDDLIFDLREGSGVPSYRITHNWRCNNATWVSVTDIKLPPLDCTDIEDGKNDESFTCRTDPVIFTPQNARKLPELEDSKKAAGKAKGAAKSTAKPSP